MTETSQILRKAERVLRYYDIEGETVLEAYTEAIGRMAEARLTLDKLIDELEKEENKDAN